MSGTDVSNGNVTATEIPPAKVLFIVTGQNPASAAVLGHRMLEVLAERATAFSMA